MKIIITGAKGMLGSMLAKVLREKKFEVFDFAREDFDITDRDEIENKLKDLQPDAVINCAAYTNVELAEDEIEKSNIINGYAPGYLAEGCSKHPSTFIHISTDYVFGDSSESGHKEDDIPQSQLNQYGKSKRLGEIEAMRNNPNSFIVRTQWVFGPGGKNFVDTMLMLAETRNELNLVDDEFGKPSYTKDISRQIAYIIENRKNLNPGFYHVINEDICSRIEQARKIFDYAGKNIKLHPVPLSSFPRKAKVSNYSILINTKLPKLRSWNEAIKEHINNLKV